MQRAFPDKGLFYFEKGYYKHYSEIVISAEFSGN